MWINPSHVLHTHTYNTPAHACALMGTSYSTPSGSYARRTCSVRACVPTVHTPPYPITKMCHGNSAEDALRKPGGQRCGLRRVFVPLPPGCLHPRLVLLSVATSVMKLPTSPCLVKRRSEVITGPATTTTTNPTTGLLLLLIPLPLLLMQLPLVLVLRTTMMMDWCSRTL